MGRVMPRQFLERVGNCLHLAAPEREKELMAAIRARAEELAGADEDMIVDEQSKGALALGAAVLAAFETLLHHFDAYERRTILYLQHEMGVLLKAPYELFRATGSTGRRWGAVVVAAPVVIVLTIRRCVVRGQRSLDDVAAAQMASSNRVTKLWHPARTGSNGPWPQRQVLVGAAALAAVNTLAGVLAHRGVLWVVRQVRHRHAAPKIS
jgi:hypothetical protein